MTQLFLHYMFPVRVKCTRFGAVLFLKVMTMRLRRASGMLRMGKIERAAEAASEAAKGHGQPPLSTVSIAARFVAASAKSMCSGVAEDEAIDELNALKVLCFVVTDGSYCGKERRILIGPC